MWNLQEALGEIAGLPHVSLQPSAGSHGELAGVLLPGTLLALMPKCPMCLAAYVALGTGFTLSYTSAHLLMRGLTALCICTLAFCVLRRIFKHLRQNHSLQLSPSHTHS